MSSGIVVDGTEHPLDCIIFATGFEFGTAGASYARRSGHEIIGRQGQTLSQYWQHGLRTLHGFYCHNFPNFFHMGPSQNGLAFAVTYFLDEQAEHIVDVLKVAKDRKARRIEPTAEAERAWVNTIRSQGKEMREFRRECTPGYYNDEGQANGRVSFFDEIYAGGPIQFYEMMRQWRAGEMMELAIT
jgi:cation diffusion facilitator CzcD-associated flavoprotein CzcO